MPIRNCVLTIVVGNLVPMKGRDIWTSVKSRPTPNSQDQGSSSSVATLTLWACCSSSQARVFWKRSAELRSACSTAALPGSAWHLTGIGRSSSGQIWRIRLKHCRERAKLARCQITQGSSLSDAERHNAAHDVVRFAEWHAQRDQMIGQIGRGQQCIIRCSAHRFSIEGNPVNDF